MARQALPFCTFVFLSVFLNADVYRAAWVNSVRDIHTVYKNGYREDNVKAVNVALNKSFAFKLTEDVEIQAFGSINFDCTSELSCNQIDYPKPNRDGKCGGGHIIVEDSYGSQRIGCGAMDFGLPIRPSRSGRDFVWSKTRGTGGGQPDHIVGGRDAGEFEYPYMATLVHTGTSSNICGASLINDRYVLTAGHCSARVKADPGEFQLVFHAHLLDLKKNGNYVDDDVPAGSFGSIKEAKGYNLKNKKDADEDRLRMNIQEVVIHPLYQQQRSGAIFYDIAIYKLERRINLVHLEYGRVGTVCLPKLGTNKFHEGDSMTVTGWGRPREDAGASNRILQELDVSIYNQTECKRQLGSDAWQPISFCGGFPEGKRDSCQGDSGSPSVYKLGKNYYEQIGLVSWGRGCARPGEPGVYSNIAELGEWIYHTTQDAVWCSRPV